MLPVLMYHSVPASGTGDSLMVPRTLVDRQWRALRSEGWTMLGLTEALAVATADPGGRIVGVTFDDGFADFLGVLDLLATHGARATLYLPTSPLEQPAHPGQRPGRYLTWAEVASLPRDLVEIGSHAHVHRPLDVLSRMDVEHEILHSRQLLAMRTGADVVSFCYPNGYTSLGVCRAVRAAGYVNACIVGRRLADPDSDRYAVPRLQVTYAHDEAKIVDLVAAGEAGLGPSLKRIAGPTWRLVRWAVYRSTGWILT